MSWGAEWTWMNVTLPDQTQPKCRIAIKPNRSRQESSRILVLDANNVEVREVEGAEVVDDAKDVAGLANRGPVVELPEPPKALPILSKFAKCQELFSLARLWSAQFPKS